MRKTAGLSLADVQSLYGVASVLWGSYERGDRNPPLSKAEELLNLFGYTLAPVPINREAVRLPKNIAAELRAIADQLEKKDVVSKLSEPAPRVS